MLHDHRRSSLLEQLIRVCTVRHSTHNFGILLQRLKIKRFFGLPRGKEVRLFYFIIFLSCCCGKRIFGALASRMFVCFFSKSDLVPGRIAVTRVQNLVWACKAGLGLHSTTMNKNIFSRDIFRMILFD